ncbi:beta-L-arabinofuranosidase domain-containing protein [Chondromyces crocatus]|uniref:Uncharacterized protein n=1 Tax=Chondromyces crocatus TaxID=52 RepID=A0A0K1EEQ4_CHOCO|nr:uncharacterized protein CMC5_034810 [Chondromyces crocatus]
MEAAARDSAPTDPARRPTRHQGILPVLLSASGGQSPKAGTPGAPGVTEAPATAGAGQEEPVVSLGVPFPPGAIQDPSKIALRHGRGKPVPVHVQVLATWPRDGSIRSALVAFRAKVGAKEQDLYQIIWGPEAEANRRPSPPLAPNPDGPITATLPASWYGQSLVSGPQVPALDDQRFPKFEQRIEQGLSTMSPAFDTLKVACSGQHRTYYDSPHALYQRFLRYGDAARFQRARAEALWFRGNEIRFSPDRQWAVHVCQPEGWTPEKPIGWGALRRMVSQGLLDDYLLTGDPASKEAIVAMGEALRLSIPAFKTKKEDQLLATERNMAFTMMILASYYALEPRPDVKASLDELVDRTVAWQARSSSGAFEHDVTRADPSECERGPKGASPFMTALLVDALMDVHALTGDRRIVGVVERSAKWLEEQALTSDRRAFRYLWRCETDAYDDSGTADLNLLVVPVFGAAYALTGDKRWLRTGDQLADIGVDAMRPRSPKHWSQSMRSFGRYLGYRAAGSTVGEAAAALGTDEEAPAAAPQGQGGKTIAPSKAPAAGQTPAREGASGAPTPTAPAAPTAPTAPPRP